MKDEKVELQVYIFTWLCIYFCMFGFLLLFYFKCWIGRRRCVAVVDCLPKKQNAKKKKYKKMFKKSSVSEFTNISGMTELNKKLHAICCTH